MTDKTPAKPSGILPKTWSKLSTPRQTFIHEYLTNGANAIAAYIAAGYADEDSLPKDKMQRRACSVLQGKAVRNALFEHENHRAELDSLKHDRIMEWVRLEHLRLAEKCEAAGDYTNATRNLEGVGRMLGAYTDGVSVDVAAQRQYTEREALEAQRLARLMLDGQVDDLPALPAPAVEPVRVIETLEMRPTAFDRAWRLDRRRRIERERQREYRRERAERRDLARERCALARAERC